MTVFVLGQAGSGKTLVVDLVHVALAARGGAVRVDRDAYKDVHPGYPGYLGEDVRTAGVRVRADTYRWQAEVESRVRAGRYDALAEAALADLREFLAEVAAYRRSGYGIEIVALAVHEALSQLGILERYVRLAQEGRARYVSWGNHDACAALADHWGNGNMNTTSRALGAAVLLSVVTLGVGACSSGTAKPIATATATGPAGTAASATPDSSTGVSMAQKVAAWFNGGGKADISTLGTDFTRLRSDASAENVSAMGGDCAILASATTSAVDYGPIPDPQAQLHWAKTLADYTTGTSLCYDGVAKMNATEAGKGIAHILAGTTQLAALGTRVLAIQAGAR